MIKLNQLEVFIQTKTINKQFNKYQPLLVKTAYIDVLNRILDYYCEYEPVIIFFNSLICSCQAVIRDNPFVILVRPQFIQLLNKMCVIITEICALRILKGITHTITIGYNKQIEESVQEMDKESLIRDKLRAV